ncbi:MAG: hypothetical protein RIS17_1272, partial [Pseudomonadota bacterium]
MFRPAQSAPLPQAGGAGGGDDLCLGTLYPT